MKVPKYPIEEILFESLNGSDPDFFELHSEPRILALGMAEEIANLGVIQPREIEELRDHFLQSEKHILKIRESMLSGESIKMEDTIALVQDLEFEP